MAPIQIRAIGGQPVAALPPQIIEQPAQAAPAIEPPQEQPAQIEPVLHMAIPLFYEGSVAVKQGDEKHPIAAYELTFKARVTATDYAYIVSKLEGHELLAEFSRPNDAGEM